MAGLGVRGRQAGVVLLLSGVVVAEGTADDYLRDIKPVLKERCYSCHGALKQKSGLRLDTAAAILDGGKEGPIVAPKDPEGSELLARLTHEDSDERMPPEGKPLTKRELEVIRKWIAAGAPLPENEAGEDDPRSHWAFQRIERPAIPASEEENPIDAFLGAKRVELALDTQPEAARTLLIRRLYLDLVGLPPSREQLRDSRRWGVIVDELLESPHHGERWARHWMDVWRYSDWYGLKKQLRNSQKHIWHWRDWIIEALNEDKGYDRMIHEMLAGDELAPEDLDTVRATGFLARNYYLFNRTSWLDNTIEHTSKAFLGLTMNCAKCHDHKYDPIEMTDYYRFRAIFEPHQVRLDEVAGEPDFEKDGIPRVFDNHLEAPTWLHLRGDEKNPDKDQSIEAGVPVLFASFAPRIVEVPLPYSAWVPGARRDVQEARLAEAKETLEKARGAVARLESAQEHEEAVPTDEGDYLIYDEFDAPDEQTWEVTGEHWKYQEGALHMTVANRENKVVHTRHPHPRDFEVTCRYTVTSGTTFKSVGVRFDRINSGADQHQVYTSAHAPDPKVQVSHSVKGKDQFPAKGKVKAPVRVGEPYELKFAVRDRLLNVWLNQEFVLAYELPERHPDGHLAISGFDAVVEFDFLKLRALPDGFVLQPVGKGSALTPEVARAKVASETAKLVRLEATIAIDRARAAGRKLGEAEAPKGEYKALRASRKALESPVHKFAQYPSIWPEKSSGRRTMLAKWITHRENPLTARVAVNHVWMRHFGEPLVESVFDFGRRAKRPLHAELLDYLAAEFIASGWSFRHLHRLMVTSKAYRLSSSKIGAEAAMKSDGENRSYWRAHTRRMEAEVVRDSLLQLAGTLDRKVGGPSLDPTAGGSRRSLYFRHSRDDKNKFLSMFDGADHLRCYRRKESIVPQQALALSNSKLALELAQKIAIRFREDGEDLDQFIGTLFEIILCRKPDGEERAACLEFCESLRSVIAEAGSDARVRVRLVHALLNHNDFVTIR
jgi:hypothetical protein